MNSQRLAPFIAYVVLTLLNYYAFKKLQKLEPNKWHKHEANINLRWLIKKVGLETTQAITIMAVFLLLFLLPLDGFTLGVAFGVFLFNVIHDYLTFVPSLKDKEK